MEHYLVVYKDDARVSESLVNFSSLNKERYEFMHYKYSVLPTFYMIRRDKAQYLVIIIKKFKKSNIS